jgi:DNA-binding NarL/FixJ family response regulator
MPGPHALLTVRGRYADGIVTLQEPVPVEGSREVLVTFLEDTVGILVPEVEYAETVRELACREVQLTRRERDVLDLLHVGLTNHEIAARLELSSGTIRNYTSSLYDKLKVRNRLEAVTRAAELDLIG